MKPISSLIYGESFWLQPKTMQKSFELRGGSGGEEIYATLEYPSTFRSRAFAATLEGRWIFDLLGFWQTGVQILRGEDQAPLGSFKFRWTGSSGTLQLVDRKTYEWKSTNFWATQFVWQQIEDQPLVEYQSGVNGFNLGDIFKTQARLHISPAAQSDPHLPLLVPLGWYLCLRYRETTAAAAA